MANAEEAERRFAQSRREKEAAKPTFAAFLSEVGASSLRAYIEHIDESDVCGDIDDSGRVI